MVTASCDVACAAFAEAGKTLYTLALHLASSTIDLRIAKGRLTGLQYCGWSLDTEVCGILAQSSPGRGVSREGMKPFR